MISQPETFTITCAVKDGADIDIENAYYQLQYAMREIGLEEVDD